MPVPMVQAMSRPILTKAPPGYRPFPRRGPAVTFVRQRPENLHAEVHPKLDQWSRSCMACPQPLSLPLAMLPDVAGPSAYRKTVELAESLWPAAAVTTYRTGALLPDGRLQLNYGVRVGDVAYGWWKMLADAAPGFSVAYAAELDGTGNRRRLSATEFKQLIKEEVPSGDADK